MSSMTAAPRMIWASRVWVTPRSFSTRAVMPTLVAERVAPTERKRWVAADEGDAVAAAERGPEVREANADQQLAEDRRLAKALGQQTSRLGSGNQERQSKQGRTETLVGIGLSGPCADRYGQE
jgi:hypothetical protein